ncbi:50S ribosomal protein L21e [Candidatus Woesearchaeota archaeon]|nr:50S ribosomal protein L21e [Candidatus Woesearchaeota archaeon]
MVKRIGGIRRKTRYKFRKEKRARGKISISKYLQSFISGDKVCLSLESAVQKGMYHPRFMGIVGVIKGKRGKCYEVAINDMGKGKTLLVHPVHLKKA